jgi:hypothetical protein
MGRQVALYSDCTRVPRGDYLWRVGGTAVDGRGTKHETSGSRAASSAAYHCVPQVPDHGGESFTKPFLLSAVRDQAAARRVGLKPPATIHWQR